jgi:SSS family transporter
MNSNFSNLDWIFFISYFFILLLSAYIFSLKKIQTTNDYFLGANTMPLWAVAFSVVATSQSAATFLGGPEYSYRGDLTYIGFYVSTFLAIVFINIFLLPKFYAIKATSVYDLLEQKYSKKAKRDAGVMFLIGRLFASGARLYIGALAISMILFNDIDIIHILIAIFILILGALVFSYIGGVRSVIYSDVLQAITYVGAGIIVFVYLYIELNSDITTIFLKLYEADKLNVIDYSLNGGFSIWSLLTGWFLLNIAAYGLDQDMTQRVLSCKNEKEAKKSLYFSIIVTIPIVLLFLAIGLLLYIFYDTVDIKQNFNGEKVTIFMYYILNQMPDGLKGLITVGAVAAALSSTNSVLSAMSSVAINDIFKPWYIQKYQKENDILFLKLAHWFMLLFAFLLVAMAILSYYWQQFSDLPLLSFALSVMAFAYSGLLGVYFSALFTKRGNQKTVFYALWGGFVSVLIMQPFILSYFTSYSIGFSWQIVVGTVVSFSIMQMGDYEK